MPKYKGVKFDLGGTEIIVPPLSLGQLRELEPQLNEMRGKTDIAAMAGYIPIITAGIQRNHPEITEAMVAENVDLGTVKEYLPALYGAIKAGE